MTDTGSEVVQMDSSDDAELVSSVVRVLDGDVRQRLQAHGGDVTLEGIRDDGTVVIRLHAACANCPINPVTFFSAIRRRLLPIVGVTEVVCDDVRVSAAAVERLNTVWGN